MRFVHVWIYRFFRELLSAHITPVTTAWTRNVVATVQFLCHSFTPGTAFYIALLRALGRVRRVPVSTVRAPLLVALRALVKKRLLRSQPIPRPVTVLAYLEFVAPVTSQI